MFVTFLVITQVRNLRNGCYANACVTQILCNNILINFFPILFSALYRATINITSVSYSAEIAAAGRNIQDLTIVRDLEAAIQKLLDSLPGLIRVRIVSLR